MAGPPLSVAIAPPPAAESLHAFAGVRSWLRGLGQNDVMSDPYGDMLRQHPAADAETLMRMI